MEFVSPDVSQLTDLEELEMWNMFFAFSLEVKEGEELMEASLQDVWLGRLSNLEIDIEECLLLTELGEEFGRKGYFPRLRKLKLWTLPSLKSLCSSIEGGSLPMLQSLVIFCCMKVKVLPWGLNKINSLD
ncbi:hypothetical protein SUGI_0134050 [Cryptomeria japonica]|nr:hypothetical protein SUGI_0134050 [Cryptomeria japonica]